ncbi:MAG: RluA family pseudouridine synthase [Clostridiales bacterium]|nr:RluA family pseudouridine synthase [Clostridiales bacterium]
MKYQEYKIAEPYQTVYHYLKTMHFSENYIKNLRKDWGNILVNEKIVNIRCPLCIGDVLKINSSPNQKTDIKTCILPLDIVYEDEYYILINKPSGISCMPNKSHYDNNLAGAILNYMQDKESNFVVRILNRLDKDTAGIIIVAKSSIAQKDIKNLDKTYHAICEGIIDKSIQINSPIKTININGVNNRKRILSQDGQDATTFVTPISHNKLYSLISLKLKHGRTHQIRLHLSSIKHSLIGDEIYGTKSTLISHTALVCKELSFFHPYLKKQLSFEIDYPQDIKKILP